MMDPRVMALYQRGLLTEGLGPEAEWQPVGKKQHQQRHNLFWDTLSDLLAEGYGDDPDADDEDLPEWMSERAVAQLKANDQ